jgi:hypothetical protein
MIRRAIEGVRRAGIAALPLALACTLVQAQTSGEAAVTRRAAELRETPGDTGRSLAALPAQSPVTRLAERHGAWVQVKSSTGTTGWLHMFDVGPAQGGSQSQGGASGVLRGVTSLFNRGGPPTTTTATSTIGIRGLGAEDLANAQPNLPAVTQMEALRQTENQARDFANRSSLAAVPVDPLPAAAARVRSGADSADPSNPQAQ